MLHLSLRDYLVAAAPLQERLQEVPRLVLHGRASGCLKLVYLVASPAAGHVQANVAVTLLLRAVHQEFLSVVELRNARDGQQEGYALLEGVEVGRALGHLAQEAVGVVVLEEAQHVVDVGVDIVVAKVLEQAMQAVLVVERVVGDAHQAEVHHRFQSRVFAEVQAAARLPVGRADGVVHPGLAYDVIVWILQLHRLTPVVHHVYVGIGIGVLANAVYAAMRDPPDGVLNQIFRHVRVLLVQVGHGGHEPAVDHAALVVVRHVGVEIGLLVVVGLHVVVEVVKPVVAGHVLHPGVVAAAVVEDHVHHHLHAFLVGLVDQSLVILVGAEAWVYAVVVCRGIAMVGAAFHVVLQHGVQPDGRHAQIFDVV